ncbi:PstS family phosphate ABC transporter substrate-binding protein [Bacillus horti]|uniref:Phosphate transport system substrate-binding protein n=1 Tax=Caldalkalibacillus horti TaxID=77523 RepID=A0ABT9VX95_9BACI|nr:substrate-binding domain-containing protein [Bacillus horti]MDQ0165599.1 phosphate transport system substrate-binding protein [Bacillus horti]
MKANIWTKLIVSIILSAAILTIGFIAFIFTELLGGTRFYTPLVVAVTLMLVVYIILWIFNLVHPKKLTMILTTFLVLCALAVTGYELVKGYQNSLASLNDQGVDLYEYAPFSEGTKAVKLDEPATWSVEQNLPVLDGATALYPLYAAFAQATYPEGEYDVYQSKVMSSNTVEAYRNLVLGKADIIFVAGPSKEQLDYAKGFRAELEFTPIGREAFVFFVNERNPVENITIEQIQDIYSGEITNWSELGGRNARIRAFQRPENSGSQTALQRLMEGKELMNPPKEDVIAGMGGIIQQTASFRNYRNALGYSFRFFTIEMVQNEDVRLLKIEGVAPSEETIKSDEYPLAAEFYAVTVKDNKKPHVDEFINWILSPQGQYLVEQTGYIPIRTFD